MPGDKREGKIPKLRLKTTDGREEIHDLAGARKAYADWRFDHGFETTVLVDGHVINSYEELVKVVAQEQYKDKQFLEVTLLPFIGGG